MRASAAAASRTRRAAMSSALTFPPFFPPSALLAWVAGRPLRAGVAALHRNQAMGWEWRMKNSARPSTVTHANPWASSRP